MRIRILSTTIKKTSAFRVGNHLPRERLNPINSMQCSFSSIDCRNTYSNHLTSLRRQVRIIPPNLKSISSHSLWISRCWVRRTTAVMRWTGSQIHVFLWRMLNQSKNNNKIRSIWWELITSCVSRTNWTKSKTQSRSVMWCLTWESPWWWGRWTRHLKTHQSMASRFRSGISIQTPSRNQSQTTSRREFWNWRVWSVTSTNTTPLRSRHRLAMNQWSCRPTSKIINRC